MVNKFDIITFGAAVVDSFVHTDVAESNHNMHYPVGAKILIKELRFDVGGGGTNTAVAFSRLGLKTGCLANVGDDANGKKILECLKKERVSFLGKVDKKQMSGYSVILDSKGGERTILTYKGANDNVSLKEINLKKLETKWIYYSALLHESFETQKKLASFVYKKGVKIAFNPSAYIINNEDFSPILKVCEVLVVNKEEAEMICKKFGKEGDLWESIHSLGPKIVLITDKDNPAIAFDGNKKYFINPHKDIKAVERTGAGDAFAAGFVAGLVAGWTIERSLELALKESESVIQYFGAKNILLYGNIKKSDKVREKK